MTPAVPNLFRQRTPSLILRRRRAPALKWVLGMMVWLLVTGCRGAPPPTQTVVKGDPVLIDRLYPPGQGPTTSQQFTLLEVYPQRLWLTGAEVAVKNDKTGGEVDGLLSGLTIGFQDGERHRQLNHMSGAVSASLFHPCAGLNSIKLPNGFGIPVMSNEILHVSSIWQNRELYRQPVNARADVTLHFIQDPDDKTVAPPKELRVYPVFVTVPATPSEPKGGGGKPPAHLQLLDSNNLQPDAEGRPAGGRWWIPPGTSEARSVVSHGLPPESELTVRLATAFAYEDWTALELYDLTSDHSLLSFQPKGPMSKEFPEGLVLDSRHRLELRVAYQNPARTNGVGAAMLVLYIDGATAQAQAL